MRVLLTTIGEKSNFMGMVPLGWALKNAGHQVYVATQPELVELVTRTGLTAVPVGRNSNFWRILDSMSAFDPRKQEVPPFDLLQDPGAEITYEALRDGFQRVVPWWWRAVNEPMLDDLVDLCRQWRPDLVVWEAVTFAGAIAARAAGAAHARFMWSTDVFGRLRRDYLDLLGRQPPEARVDPHAEWLERCADRHGVGFTEDMTTGQFTIDYLPPSLRRPLDLDYLSVRHVPYNGRAVVPDWLRGHPEKPRVCLTLGSSATERTGGYDVSVQDLLNALSGFDVEVVATLPREEQQKLDHVPDNARLVEFVPLDALMPTCAAVINHGGPGTVFTAMDHAVPQVIMPRLFDQPVLAGLVEAQGSALSLHTSEATGERVAASLERVLSEPGFRDSAARLREESATLPGPDAAAALMEERTGRLRG